MQHGNAALSAACAGSVPTFRARLRPYLIAARRRDPQDFPPRLALSWGKNERRCGKTDPQDGLASWGRPFAPPRQSSLGVGRRSPPRLPAFRERATRGKKARWHALGAAHIAHAQGPAATERPIDLHSPVVRPVVRQHADHHREADHSCGGRSSSHLGDHYTQEVASCHLRRPHKPGAQAHNVSRSGKPQRLYGPCSSQEQVRLRGRAARVGVMHARRSCTIRRFSARKRDSEPAFARQASAGTPQRHMLCG